MRIDAHHHFWKYDPEQYGWIDDSMRTIRRDFLPFDLEIEITNSRVSGVISVQARQSLEETRCLLEHASEHPFILGVVGWVDLVCPKVGDQLGVFAVNPKLRSIRHVIQGEPDDDFVLSSDFNRGIRELKAANLAYDLLIVERQLPQTIEFVDRHPDQIFVLDHIAKPRIREEMVSPWDVNIRELAKRPNVFCKISGMITEADFDHWTPAQLQPYFETVLDAFGPDRLMFASDWPVCLVAASYSQWIGTVSAWISRLSIDEQQQIWEGTARKAYQL